MRSWGVWSGAEPYPNVTIYYAQKTGAEDAYNTARRAGQHVRLERWQGDEREVLREANVPMSVRMRRVNERLAAVGVEMRANVEQFRSAIESAIPRMERALGSPVRFSGVTALGFDGSQVDQGVRAAVDTVRSTPQGIEVTGRVPAALADSVGARELAASMDLPPAWQDRIAEWADMARQGRTITLQNGRRAGRTHLNETMQRFQSMVDAAGVAREDALPLTRDNEPVTCTDPGCVHTDPKKEMG